MTVGQDFRAREPEPDDAYANVTIVGIYEATSPRDRRVTTPVYAVAPTSPAFGKVVEVEPSTFLELYEPVGVAPEPKPFATSPEEVFACA